MPPINGTSGNDNLNGGSGADTINGLGGNDTIHGNGGDDLIYGGTGNDTLYGDDGNDTFHVNATGQGIDRYIGGTGNDTISVSASAGSMQINLFQQSDLVEAITGSGGTVVIGGSSGNDFLDFTLTTLTNVAAIRGGLGNDTIIGSAAADIIQGQEGDDTLKGGGGNDIFRVTATFDGFDSYDGGAGNDTIEATFNNSRIGVSGPSALVSIETISGGAATGVFISGNTGIDLIDLTNVNLLNITYVTGGDGADDVIGNSLINDLRGGAGNDSIQGRGGADALSGDAGSDMFRYTAITDSAVGSADVIADFSQADGDLIDLTGIDADLGAPGDQPFALVANGTDPFSGAAGQLRYQNSGGTTTIQADVDGDASADFEIVLTGTISLTTADFIL